MRRFHPLLLSLLLLLATLPPAPALYGAADQPAALPAGWQSRTLATRGNAGQRSLLLTDSRGRPHILYTQDTLSSALRHAWSDGVTWRDELVVQFAAGQFLGGRPLRFAGSGDTLAAAWQEPSSGQVTVATRSAGGWSSRDVPALSQISSFSLGLLRGRPAFAYYHQSRLHFAWLDADNQWQSEIADDSGWVGDFNSIAISPDGVVHVAYLQSDALDFRYARRTPAAEGEGGSWSQTTLHSYGNAGAGTAIALDSQGRPHMAYVVHENFGGVNLYYVYETPEGGWSPSLNAASNRIGSNLALALDSRNQPSILFSRYGQDAGAYLTSYETQIGGWSNTALGGEIAGGLGLDSADRPQVSYYDTQFQDLKFAIRADVWTEAVDVAGLVNDSAHFGAALDGENGPRFSLSGTELAERSWADGTWRSDVITGTTPAATHSSLAYDSSGQPHVAFYRSGSGDLLYGRRVDGAWETALIDAAGDVGAYPRLLLRNGQQPVIVYWDESNQRLKVAERVNGSWLIAGQQNGPPLNSDSSRFDAAGFAPDGSLFITYFDAPNTDLRLARVLRRGLEWTWTDSLIGGSEGETGRASAAALGGSGLYLAVAFSYTSPEGVGALRYGWMRSDGNSPWNIGQLANPGSQGKAIIGVDVALKSGSHEMGRVAFVTRDNNNARQLWLGSKDGQIAGWRFELMAPALAIAQGRIPPPAVLAEGVDRVAWVDVGHLYLRSRYSDEDRPTSVASGSIRPGNPELGFLCACLILQCWTELTGRSAAQSAAELPLEAQLHAQFAATAEGERYVELYRTHGREIYERIAADPALLWDTWRALENYTPALIALAAGEGEQTRLTSGMLSSSLDIWQRLAAAGSPELAAAINAELAATDNLADFTNKTVAESAEAIGVDPQALARMLLYLPLTVR